MKHLVLALILLLGWQSTATALDTKARAALVYDVNTGTMLLSKDADTALPPASMSKLMTLNMLFEALRDGRVQLDTKFTVSAKASKKGGSRMFLRVGEQVSVENLIKGIIVQSGNDACIVVAENMAGSEAEFARLMTNRAAKLGMRNSRFANATGWPDPGQRMSPRDLVFIAQRLINEFPEYYAYFGVKSFAWSKIVQENRNPLLKLGIGADGLKTGHTKEAGYGLVGSAVQGNRRVIVMITGLASAAERASESERLLNWAFRQFAEKKLFEAGQRIVTADVWMGRSSRVGLVAQKDIVALVPYETGDNMELSVSYTGPLQAPVSTSSEVARLHVTFPNMPATSYPLYAESSIAKGGLFSRVSASAKSLTRKLFGATSEAAN